jgi:hypothetical protein
LHNLSAGLYASVKSDADRVLTATGVRSEILDNFGARIPLSPKPVKFGNFVSTLWIRVMSEPCPQLLTYQPLN